MEKGRKKNFSECEVEVLISEVEARNNILFGSLSSGISTKIKKLAWEKVAKSVNDVGAESRTVADIKKKVVGHKGRRKKKGFCPPEKRGSDGQRSRSRGARPI